MYSNPYCTRQTTPLLEKSDITDKRLLTFQRTAESIINSLIASRYMIPIQKIENPKGNVSTIKNDETIIGVDTLFTQDIKPGDMIRVNKSGEALRVDEVISDTEIKVEYHEPEEVANEWSYSGKPLFNSSDSSYMVVPEDLVTAVNYETARLALLTNVADRARNKENSKYSFLDEYEMVAKPIITNLKEGLYYDSSLKSQIQANSTGRNVEVFQTTTVDNTVAFIEDIEQLFKST